MQNRRAVIDDEGRDPPPDRVATAHLRQLPDFVIIGTQRGGTTSLFRYLTDHPAVGRPYRKEVRFFDEHFDLGRDWYLAHFPLLGKVPFVGEASPNYLLHPEAPGRALATVPQARFLALLRNPIDRAHSQYQMNLRRGVESLSFEDAIEQEPDRLARSPDPASVPWRLSSYLTRGLYADQLERWLRVFPYDQLLVIASEELYKQPDAVVAQAAAFVGLPWRPTSYKAYHLSEYADLDPATRRRLARHFAGPNERLFDLLGRRFPWDTA
jgi:hypothetical protein